MEGNKLKHSFVNKDESKERFINEWLRVVRRDVHPLNVEQSFLNYEDVVIRERVLDITLEQNNVEYIKESMARELGKKLLEQGFIDFNENKNFYTDCTEFKMCIKAIKNHEDNVR